MSLSCTASTNRSKRPPVLLQLWVTCRSLRRSPIMAACPVATLPRARACLGAQRRALHTRVLRCRRRSGVVVFSAAAEGRVKFFSPSKINVFLRVMRRREDGYHDLASLFHVIDLGDELEFMRLPGATKDELVCNVADVPVDDSNLVIKALNLFRSKTGSSDFFRVRLEKVVPHGAGLGGGSGNAATTLWAANELAGRPASEEDLLAWGGEIGSDISVFFSQGAAYCTGRGEIVENVEPPLPLSTPLLLVKPPVGLSTPEIFRALDLEKRNKADPRELLKELHEKGALQSLCVNDLEQPAFDRLPLLKDLKERLQKKGNFPCVFMTGSGSTIVCVGSDEPPEFLFRPKYQERYGELFLSPARLLTRHPGQWYQRTRGGVSKEQAMMEEAVGC